MTEEYVYVVTRSKRRIEAVNYPSFAHAEVRAQVLKEALKEWDPGDIRRVEIVRTKKPNQIR
tara:strand:- start:13112 stop:13297 length:186 start_codon:yes stop_codon:yes gene_type:complete